MGTYVLRTCYVRSTDSSREAVLSDATGLQQRPDRTDTDSSRSGAFGAIPASPRIAPDCDATVRYDATGSQQGPDRTDTDSSRFGVFGAIPVSPRTVGDRDATGTNWTGTVPVPSRFRPSEESSSPLYIPPIDYLSVKFRVYFVCKTDFPQKPYSAKKRAILSSEIFFKPFFC